MIPYDRLSRIFRGTNRVDAVSMTGVSSRASSTSSRPDAVGAIALRTTDLTRQSIIASTVGLTNGSGLIWSKPWRTLVRSRKVRPSTALTSRHIVRRMVEKGGASARHWSLARRPDHKNPCPYRCDRTTLRLLADGGQCL